MIDPVVSLALSIETNPGAYALLVGSGVSVSAHVPSGWGVVLDLTRRLAALTGEDPGNDPAQWYLQRFGHEPDYSVLLDALAKTPAERNRLLTAYFEPDEEEQKKGWKAPTPAHRAIAEMMRSGHVRVVVTTNFDRLLEKALSDLDLNPKVVSSADDAAGALPLIHTTRPFVLKINGDYLDTRSRNTPEELAAYDGRLATMLDTIFGDFGLIIAGWSGRYDHALIDSYRRSRNTHFSTYWVDPVGLNDDAKDLLALRDGTYVRAASDEFFVELADKVLAEERARRQIADRPAIESIPNNLPRNLTSFIGRDQAVASLAGVIARQRLLTLVGPGGSGKTRLALKIAESACEHFDSGVWFADLSSIRDPNLVPSAIGRAVGLRDQTKTPVTDAITDHLADRSALLVLDNCEQVTLAAAGVAGHLLGTCPKLHILATSRGPLGLSTERVGHVPPLDLPDESESTSSALHSEAVQLFVERARSVVSGFEVSTDALGSIVSICRHLDGLPLAIELAAARTRVLTPQQIERKLASRFKLLTAGPREAADRQRTLRGAIDWSYELLEETEQAFFSRVSMFRGGFNAAHATTLCLDSGADEFEALDLIDSLVNKSLLVVDTSAEDARYRQLESVQAYGQERLEESGELGDLLQRHAAHFASFAATHRGDLVGPRQARWFDVFEDEHANFRQALSWFLDAGDNPSGLALAINLAQFWHFRGYITEAVRWYDLFLDESTQIPRDLLIKGLTVSGNFANIVSDHELALEFYSRALRLAEESRDQLNTAHLCNNIGLIEEKRGQLDDAYAHHQKALTLYRELGDERSAAMALSNAATILRERGEFTAAQRQLDEAFEINTKIGDEQGLSNNLTHLGAIAEGLGHYEDAVEKHQRALEIRRALGYKSGIGFSLLRLASVHLNQGELRAAEREIDEAIQLYEATGISTGLNQAEVLRASLHLENGHHAEARRLLLGALDHAADRGQAGTFVAAMDALVRVELEDGRLQRACCLLGANDRVREDVKFTVPPARRASLQDLADTLRERLGSQVFEREVQRGRRLSLREAIDEATAPIEDDQDVDR